jgi:hypothetical protein
MRRETSRVSFLMCPFCVRALMPSTTTRAVDGSDNKPVPLVTYKELAPLCKLFARTTVASRGTLGERPVQDASFAGRLALDQEAPAS